MSQVASASVVGFVKEGVHQLFPPSRPGVPSKSQLPWVALPPGSSAVMSLPLLGSGREVRRSV